MEALDIIMIAVALAMDCFAVSVMSGLILQKPRFRDVLVMALFFGGFQGMMTVAGWLAGSGFSEYIESFDHWVAFGLLFVIGANMIRESFDEEDAKPFDPTNMKTLVGLAVATSIDALAVGINLGIMCNSLLSPSLLIAMVSFVLTIVGAYLGASFRHLCKFNFGLVGGVVLIGIGVKILIEHLLF